MIKKIINYLLDVRDLQRMAIAVSKGGAMMHGRDIDLRRPETWEFSGFSQNGEDGVLDVLRKKLLSSNRYFIEIGAANGIQNNTSWLAVAEQYNGLMVEGDPWLVERAKRLILNHSIGVECLNVFVNSESVAELKFLSMYSDPDVFSLDIDGVDYYIAKEIMDRGFRPKIFVVEYNSVYGPTQSMTIPYEEKFIFSRAHPTQLYYGVSIAGWRKFFDRYGYHFVTVDRKGVNAFFVDPACFDAQFLSEIKGSSFAENVYQYKKFKGSFEKQFSLIEDREFEYI